MKQLKSFGQHFLKDQNVLNKIDDVLCFSEKPVIEIGPGAGALTSILLNKTQDITVIEADVRWCDFLAQKFKQKLTVLNMDALQYEWKSVLPGAIIVGNLPYQIASELMIQLAVQDCAFKYCVFMMQYEVAQRAMADPSSKNYGRLSVILQTQFDFEECFDVPPDAFDPPPKVDSSVIKILKKKVPLCSLDALHTVEKITRLAFSQRRKKCRNVLSPMFSKEQLTLLGVDPDSRAEAISPSIYVGMAQYLLSNKKV
jgi:16S rRNA (adenine1518-N6/adenine1519-N6)-dimethyltransferase